MYLPLVGLYLKKFVNDSRDTIDQTVVCKLSLPQAESLTLLSGITINLGANMEKHSDSLKLKMFNFFKRHFFSALCFTMSPEQNIESESFSSLLAPDLCTNTDAFLSVYRDGISQSDDSKRIPALTRFQVEAITVSKISQSWEHELLSAAVLDTATHQPYTFFIERNASPPRSDPQASSSSSTLPVELIAGTSLPALSVDLDIPLARLSNDTNSLGSPSSPSSPSPSTSSASLLPRLQSYASQYKLREKFSLSSTRAAHTSSASLNCVAEDHILGRGMRVGEIGRVARQIKPTNLSLFELGILADVIHDEAPVYSLLQNQCYWFAGTLCDAVVLLYGDELCSPLTDGAQLGPSCYLPKLAGRWKNMLIIEPKSDVLARVLVKFVQRQEEEFSKVSFF